MLAHIIGIPAEEALLQLAPAGVATLAALAVAVRVRIERLIGRRWRR